MTKVHQLDTLATDYLPAFFAFGMKHTGGAHEAEEFAQEAAYQCVLAINKTENIQNFNAFIWGIAHNTYKRWLARKKYVSLDDTAQGNFGNIVCPAPAPETELLKEEDKRRIHLELSRLTDLYRKVVVHFHFDEMPLAEISERLNISLEMVKFYLQKGRKKLKEAYEMHNIGEKSFNPSDFTVMQYALETTKVDVWQLFSRKLPCQIALVCYDSDRTISDISLETGVPAVYLEEEVTLLMDAGVIISPVRGKYRTNFSIMKKNALRQFMTQFAAMQDSYVPHVMDTFDRYLPRLKQAGIFKQEVGDSRYAWVFAGIAPPFDVAFPFLDITESDAPVTLSCGAPALVFAAEAPQSPWLFGKTPIAIQGGTVWPCDMKILGEWRFYGQLSQPGKAQALLDAYNGNTGNIQIYAQLLEEGYLIKQDGKLFCNVAVLPPQAKEIFAQINAELSKVLKPLCKELRANVGRLVKATLPPQLKAYAKGFTETWIMVHAQICFYEALYAKGFIVVPEEDANVPVACVVDMA